MITRVIYFIISTFFFSQSLASSDVFPSENRILWIWEDQLKPTIERSWDKSGIFILLSGGAMTSISHQYDDTIRRYNQDPRNRMFTRETSDIGAYLGSGTPAIAIAVTQLIVDTENGLQHARAIALTAANHITLATIIHRERPERRDYLSMPSGHASSSFATATSLAYSYGWKIGVPAYLTATFIAASRVNENIHWLSDVVAGAALGIYWGRASALLTKDKNTNDLVILPLPTPDGGVISLNWNF